MQQQQTAEGALQGVQVSYVYSVKIQLTYYYYYYNNIDTITCAVQQLHHVGLRACAVQ